MRKSMTRKAQPPALELTISGLNEDGLGTARHGGKEVLVAGALPGEKVLAAVEHEGMRRIVGRLLKVVLPSTERVPSPCGAAKRCQGCPLIGFDYQAQLAFKADRVRAALASYPSLAGTKVHPVWAAPHPLGYRTSAKLTFGRQRGEVRLGLYRRGSHEVVDTIGCPVHHPLINRIAQAVKEEVARQEIYIYNSDRRRGLLRYLGVKVSPSSGKALVTIVTAERNFNDISRLANGLLRKVPEVIGVHQNVNASEGTSIFGRETLKMVGAPDLLDQIGDVRLRIAPTAFLQVNHDQAAQIYAEVRRWAGLSREESALDLYCGLGGIALHLGLDAGRVLGVEVAEEAVRSARENARLNSLPNCRFQAGNAAEVAADLPLELANPAVAVLNPPRSGCEATVLEALAGLAPRTLIYVSCFPETLARDLDLLAGRGYQAAEVQPVDMFPQTAHVESIVRLVRAPASGPAPGAGRPRKRSR